MMPTLHGDETRERARFSVLIVLAALVPSACSRACSPGTTGQSKSATIVQIASAKDTTCARTRSGEVLCWGDDAFTSQTMTQSSLPEPTRTRPTKVLGLKGAVALDVAASTGCAVDSAGALVCFVDRMADRTGSAPPLVARPVEVDDAVEVSMGLAPLSPVCVLGKNRQVRCLSSERESMPRDPKEIPGLEEVESIAQGDTVTCVLRNGGKLWCWGSQFGGFKPLEQALAGPPLLDGVKQVSAGSAFACAVGTGGKITCFGSTKGTPPSEPAVLVRAGVYHACMIDTGQHVRCWGDNRFGQLGELGANAVAGIEDAVDVAVGEWHTCALEKSGRVRCWGRNARGQLGDGTSTDRSTAADVDF